MINAGAILVCSLLKTLIKPEMTLAEKFDYTMQWFRVGKSDGLKFNKKLKLNYFAEIIWWRELWLQ